uniref:C2H2-type domain-containing protein n=1 Tax=Globodera pallida TaxID=36090 RepID=A0A183BL23_GLOPA
MMGARGQTPAPSNKPPPQKRQYSSTSKNFCDLCNKEVCNKYFLRTHMLKMHNIIIDENKQLIANIDTADKERKGEVKFRCDICHASMNTRDELKLHKREAHGMSTGGGAQSTPLGSRGAPKAALSTAATSSAGAMDAAGGTQQQKLVTLPPFPAPASHFSATMEHHQQTTQQPMSQLRTTPEGTAGANDENQPLGEQQTTRESAGGTQQSPLVGANPMKQLLSLIGGDETLPPSLVGGARLLPATGFVLLFPSL